MPVPRFLTLVDPILDSLSDGLPKQLSDLRSDVAESIGLTEEDLAERLPSGPTVFNSRVRNAIDLLGREVSEEPPQHAWSCSLVWRLQRGVVQLTERGRAEVAHRAQVKANPWEAGSTASGLIRVTEEIERLTLQNEELLARIATLRETRDRFIESLRSEGASTRVLEALEHAGRERAARQREQREL